MWSGRRWRAGALLAVAGASATASLYIDTNWIVTLAVSTAALGCLSAAACLAALQLLRRERDA